MEKITISQDFFIKVLKEKLSSVNDRLIKADELTYSNQELIDVWTEISQSSLIIDEILDSLP